jgi:phosphoribosylanthranilate isomerase
MSLIKICGLSRLCDIAFANRCLPDFIGFIFAESRRRVDEAAAAALRSMLDPRVKAVGVFVNDSVERIAGLCAAGVIDIAQLHGDEDEAFIGGLRRAAHCKIIKSVPAGSGAPWPPPHLASAADYLLFDSYSPGARGGTGVSFDWAALAGVRRPYFLAGGLDAAKLPAAIGLLRPYCVDLNSGVETGGRKDFGKMQEAVGIVRRNDFRGAKGGGRGEC